MLLAVIAAAAAGWVATVADQGRQRLPRMAGAGGRAPAASAAASSSFGRVPAWLDPPTVAAVLAGIATVRLVDGPAGWLAGPLVAAGCWRWFLTLERAPQRRRREQMVRELPVAVDLLVACLRAGQPVADSLVAVADAWPGVVGQELRTVSAQLALGGDPVEIWRDWPTDPALEPLARAFVRAARSGASIAVTLEHASSDLRRQRRWAGQASARSVGVRTAAPLGLCFMPAFVVLGVVPTVISTFATVVL